jgi:nucleotide-binding universal stress UspA family protein
MGHIHKILVPMDGSPPSMAALWEAVALAEDLQAAIDVLHVRAPNRFEVGSATATAQGSKPTARWTRRLTRPKPDWVNA